MDWFVEDLQDPASYRLNKLEDVFIDLHESFNKSDKESNIKNSEDETKHQNMK